MGIKVYKSLPERALRVETGSPTSKLILLQMTLHSPDDECQLSYSQIAYLCETSKNTVIRHIDHLVKLGIVNKKSMTMEHNNGHSANSYTFNL